MHAEPARVFNSDTSHYPAELLAAIPKGRENEFIEYLHYGQATDEFRSLCEKPELKAALEGCFAIRQERVRQALQGMFVDMPPMPAKTQMPAETIEPNFDISQYPSELVSAVPPGMEREFVRYLHTGGATPEFAALCETPELAKALADCFAIRVERIRAAVRAMEI